ncbi:endonuclease/exonuclease/phosphatase family protein [Akkermansiaceae bacterium]|nr:endonuclease/exonuclease/phosphatase family protein [Akkermansiaceae bacterium]
MKKILKIILWVIALTLLWFGVIRATSGSRAVTVSGDGGVLDKWDGTLKIGCYNIAHGRGEEPGGSNWEGGSKKERKQRLDEIADLIREQDLDLVILNEVDFNCTWSHGVNQAQALAEDCGYPFVVEQRNLDLGIPFFRVAIGNAILSRFPIGDASGVEYPEVKWWEPIAAGKKEGVKVVVNLPDDASLELCGVHTETRDAKVRKGSVEALLKSAGERSVLAGDFNSVRAGDGTTAIDLIFNDGRWKEAKASGATFPTAKPEIRIDWIFVPRDWEELNSKVLVKNLSDHAMVVGEWKVK